VALRRLRSALRIFRPLSLQSVGSDLKWLTGALSDARDWDVLMTETLPAMLAALAESHVAKILVTAGEKRRDAARNSARAALSSGRAARTVILLGRLVTIPGELSLQEFFHTAAGDAERRKYSRRLHTFAAHEIRRRHRRLLQVEGALAELTVENRHRVRIGTKRLRYAVDFFSSLFVADRVSPYAKIIGEIQDLLGEANDGDVALRLLASLVPPRRVADFARGWVAARTKANLTGIDRRIAALKVARHFWKY
jgi:CHAD domain-containing protein